MDPPGLRFGSLLDLKIGESSLGIPLGAPGSRTGDLFFGPGALEERSKRLPRGLQETSRLPRELQELSKRLRDRFWSDFGGIWGAILEPFWKHFGTSLGDTVCSYLSFKETEKQEHQYQQNR